MAVSEISMALGQWSVQLRQDTPRYVLDSIGYLGHVAITAGRVNPALVGDGLLKTARYVGVVTGITKSDLSQPKVLSGAGMAFWLGDSQDKGSVLESAVSLTAASFNTWMTNLLPASGSVTAGFLSTSVPGTLTQSYQWVSPRTAINGVCSLMGGTGTAAAEWRVNGDGTLDAGLVSELFVTSPTAAIVRKNTGPDMAMRALRGTFQNAGDVIDYTTRAIVLAGGSTPTVGTANLGSVPYNDIHGNVVKLTRVAQQSQVASGNANAAAAAQLALYNSPRNQINLTTDEYDVKGFISVGDYVWVQDPDSGLIDLTQEVHLRGEVLNPVLLRCVELDWPVLAGMGVAYRDINGNWTDLTDYLIAESGPATVVVGATTRPLAAGLSSVSGNTPLPYALSQSATADTTVNSATLTDLTGATITLTTGAAAATVYVTATFDMQVATAGTATATGHCIVDGVDQSGQATGSLTTLGQRQTTSQTWKVTLSGAGSHTIKLQGVLSAASGSMTFRGTHTKLSLLVLDF